MTGRNERKRVSKVFSVCDRLFSAMPRPRMTSSSCPRGVDPAYTCVDEEILNDTPGARMDGVTAAMLPMRPAIVAKTTPPRNSRR